MSEPTFVLRKHEVAKWVATDLQASGSTTDIRTHALGRLIANGIQVIAEAERVVHEFIKPQDLEAHDD